MTLYFVRAQQKVGAQNIGPYLGYAIAEGDKVELVAKMQALFPRARVAANVLKTDGETVVRNHEELRAALKKPAGTRVYL